MRVIWAWSHLVMVRDARDLLLDDGPRVQLRRRIVRRRADDLDAALVRAVVRHGALERGQEAVVDVDRVLVMPLAELRAQDLHVPEQDSKEGVCTCVGQQGGCMHLSRTARRVYAPEQDSKEAVCT